MTRGIIVVIALISVATIIAVYSFAPVQGPAPTGCLFSGFVRDAAGGAPISGATVVGVANDGNDASLDSWTIRTGGDGRWAHSAICSSPYRVSASADGFSPSSRTLGPGSASWDFLLSRT